MEILTKKNLVGAKTAPTVIPRTFTPFSEENQVSLVRIHFSHTESDGKSADVGAGGRIRILIVGRREKTPTPKTRFSIWILLRTPGRFTTRPLPVHFATKMSVVRPFFGP